MMMVMMISDEGFLVVCELLGKEGISDGGKQLFEEQPDARVESVIADDDSVTGPQKNPSDDGQIMILQLVLRDRQLRLHLPASLGKNDLAEGLLASGEKRFGDGQVIGPQLDGNVPLHQSQHALHDQLLQKFLVNSLVANHLPQPVADLSLQLLHVLIARSHASNAVAIVQGGSITT